MFGSTKYVESYVPLPGLLLTEITFDQTKILCWLNGGAKLFLAYFRECWSRVTRSLSKSDIDSRLNVAFRFLVFPIAANAIERKTLLTDSFCFWKNTGYTLRYTENDITQNRLVKAWFDQLNLRINTERFWRITYKL